MLKEEKFINEWLDFLKNNKRYSKNTIESYQFDIQNLVKFNFNFLKKNSLAKFDSEDVQSWLIYRKNNNDTCARTNCRGISAFKSFLKFLQKNKIEISDNLLYTKMPKFSNSLPKAVSVHEIKFSNLLKLGENGDWPEIQDKAILILIYACGLRISEALHLHLNDINFDEMLITIRNTKSGKERIVPIIKFAIDNLINHFYHCPFINNVNLRDNFKSISTTEISSFKEYEHILTKAKLLKNLFFTLKGTQMSRTHFALRLKKLLPLYNLPYGTSSHSFRHSFATHLLENGANLKQIQNLLGHSKLSSSEIYTKVTNNLLKKMYFSAHPRLK